MFSSRMCAVLAFPAALQKSPSKRSVMQHAPHSGFRHSVVGGMVTWPCWACPTMAFVLGPASPLGLKKVLPVRLRWRLFALA